MIDVGTRRRLSRPAAQDHLPGIKLTLLEATGKKVEFLRHMVALLDLRGVTVVKGRAEEVGRDAEHREQYDWALARAVAEMPTLVEYLLPFVRIGGRALAQKGEDAPAEVAAGRDGHRSPGRHGSTGSSRSS